MDQVLVADGKLMEAADGFAPLVTPPIVPATTNNNNQTSSQRFVLLPHRKYVVVHSFQTGRRLGVLLPELLRSRSDQQHNNNDHDEPATTIQSVALGSYSSTAAVDSGSPQNSTNHVLWMGCRHGVILEFALDALLEEPTQHPTGGPKNGGPRVARWYRPQRQIRLAAPASAEIFPVIEHLMVVTATNNLTAGRGGNDGQQQIVYAVLSREDDESGQKQRIVSRCSWHASDNENDDEIEATATTVVDKLEDKPIVEVHAVPSTTPNKTAPNLLIAYPQELHVHCCIGSANDDAYAKVEFPMPRKLTAAAVSPHGRDVACGLETGEISVLTNVLALAETFAVARHKYDAQQNDSSSMATLDKPRHPARSLVKRKLHWHAHPVAALAYDPVAPAADIEPMLYSAGEESVLISWQLSEGSSKPAETLPRVALAGIRTITMAASPSSHTSILMYSADNSLQLVAAHNFSRVWKTQGLAGPEHMVAVRGDRLLCSNHSLTPGHLHWYDPLDSFEVKESLMVAPFNRVSRAHRQDQALPAPSVPLCAMSDQALVTVDIVSTENKSIGRDGKVSTIRFWSRPENNSADYQLAASMSHPHGKENRVAAVAISPNGTFASSLSRDEGAFRIWQRLSSVPNNETPDHPIPTWDCAFKVTIPAGLSNQEVNPNALGFSSDSTILAIAFGNIISLWDHREATLVHTIGHASDDHGVESLQFLRSTKVLDMLLTCSKTGVCLQSPFGGNGPRNLGWSYCLPDSHELLDVEYMQANDAVALAVYDEEASTSQIVWIDAVSGEQIPEEIGPITGRIKSLTAALAPPTSNWGKSGITEVSKPTLFVLMEGGEIICIKAKVSGTSAAVDPKVVEAVEVLDDRAPTISMVEGSRKRAKSLLSRVEYAGPSKKRLTLNPFGGTVGDIAPPISSDLPNLQGAFLRSFVSRHLVEDD